MLADVRLADVSMMYGLVNVLLTLIRRGAVSAD